MWAYPHQGLRSENVSYSTCSPQKRNTKNVGNTMKDHKHIYTINNIIINNNIIYIYIHTDTHGDAYKSYHWTRYSVASLVLPWRPRVPKLGTFAGWGPPSDIWTLGVTGCFLVSGQLGFNSHDPQEFGCGARNGVDSE
jgi:hypothetical protein